MLLSWFPSHPVFTYIFKEFSSVGSEMGMRLEFGVGIITHDAFTHQLCFHFYLVSSALAHR